MDAVGQRLRAKIEPEPSRPLLIHTVHGSGDEPPVRAPRLQGRIEIGVAAACLW